MKNIHINTNKTKMEDGAYYFSVSITLFFFFFFAALFLNEKSIEMLIFLGLIGIYMIIELVKFKHIFSDIKKKDKGYISDIQINDKAICFVHTFNNKKSVKIFNFSDIKGFKMNISAIYYLTCPGCRYRYSSVINLDIEITTNETVSNISMNALDDFYSNAYDVIYAIFEIAEKIPNFSYTIKGNNKKIIEEALQCYLNTK